MSDIDGLMKINIRTDSLEQAEAVFGKVLGAEMLRNRGSQTIGDFDGATFKVGDLVLDIMAPNDPEGRLAKTIEKRGEGLDSLCFRVSSLDDVEARLAEHDIAMINKHDFHGNKIGFVHPKDCCGVMIEFIQPAES